MAVQGLVLAALVGGTTAFGVLDKTVTVSVDGQPRTVHTYATDVRGVLDRAGLAVGPHDVLAPAPGTSVHDGSKIVIARGRPVTLDVDGKQRIVWVTQPTVDDVVQSLGMRADGAYLSASRSREIPLSGMALTIRLPQTVTVAVHGRPHRYVTTAATVGDLLREQHIRVGRDDVVGSPLSYYPASGTVVRITQVTRQRMLKRIPVRFGIVRVADASMFTGTHRVVRQGRQGRVFQWWVVTSHNGRVVDRRKTGQRRFAPVAEVVHDGTRARPAPRPAPAPVAPAPAPAPAPVAPAPAAGGSGGGLNWSALAQCESGGDPGLVDGPYYGLYQFDMGTWASVGGSGLPSNASPAEQLARAERLYAMSGRSPWPVCGRYL